MANSRDASDTLIRDCVKGTKTFPFCLEVNLLFMTNSPKLDDPLNYYSSSSLKLPYRTGGCFPRYHSVWRFTASLLSLHFLCPAVSLTSLEKPILFIFLFSF